MIIAIDGPAGSGKSTIAQYLADTLQFTFLNTGSFYRGITLAFLRSQGGEKDGSGAEPSQLRDQLTMAAFARGVSLDYRNGHLFLEEEDVEPFLRSDAVESLVAPLSAIVELRHIVNEKFRSIAKHTNIVCEGRDMTTVVFPDAQYKFYLDASVEARAKRRFDQGTSKLSLLDIEKTIRERDQIDQNKKEGSLKIAPDAVYIDTSHLTIKDVCAMIISKIHL